MHRSVDGSANLGAVAPREAVDRARARSRRSPISRERARVLSIAIAGVMMLAGIWLISAPMRARRRAAKATPTAAATTLEHPDAVGRLAGPR